MRIPVRFILVTAVAVVIASCDSAPGLQPANTPAPSVSGLLYSPTFVDLSSVSPQDTVGGVVPVTIEISVSVEDGDDNLRSVEYLLQSPLIGAPVIDQQDLSANGAGQYNVSTVVEIPVGAVGLYTLLVFATDDAGNISNQVRGLLNFGSSEPFGTPPVIEMVEASPDPAVPGQVLQMIATVSDAEGLSNILEVLISTGNLTNLQMLDDGGVGGTGDATAGDGRFTASFGIPADQPPDTTVFFVQAFDRNGLSSEIVSKEVTVQ